MATRHPILLGSQRGTLLQNLQFENRRHGTVDQEPWDQALHPHLIDIYQPDSVIENVIVAMHGGGGTKLQYAAALGILLGYPPTPERVAWGPLETWKCALIVPQGQHCKGVDPNLGPGNNPFNPLDVNTVSSQYPKGIPTWSNHVMWSSVDDMQFVRDCAAEIEERYPGARKILAGHSNGGIMANRAWYEHQAGMFDVYCGTSGPAGIYHQVDDTSVPTVVRPYFDQFGELDENLGIIGGHFYDPTWELSQLSKAFARFPATVISGLVQLQTRVNAYNAAKGFPPQTVQIEDGTTEPADTGTRTTWGYSFGANVLRLFSAAEHSTKSLQFCNGRRHIADWVLFAILNDGA